VENKEQIPSPCSSTKGSSPKTSPKEIQKKSKLVIKKEGKAATHRCWKCKKPPTAKYFRDGHLFNCEKHARVHSKKGGRRACARERREEERKIKEEKAQKAAREARASGRSDASDN
jgi:hypothetical protein